MADKIINMNRAEVKEENKQQQVISMEGVKAEPVESSSTVYNNEDNKVKKYSNTVNMDKISLMIDREKTPTFKPPQQLRDLGLITQPSAEVRQVLDKEVFTPKERMKYLPEKALAYGESQIKGVGQLLFKTMKGFWDTAWKTSIRSPYNIEKDIVSGVSGWLDKQVDYWNNSENYNYWQSKAQTKRAHYAHEAKQKGTLVEIGNTMTETIGDLALYLASVKLLKAVTALGTMGTAATKGISGGQRLTSIKKHAKFIGTHGFVTTQGDIKERLIAAGTRIGYNMTPYVVNATGLTGFSAVAGDIFANSFLTLPTYIQGYQEAGGLSKEFAMLALPQFVVDAGMAWNTRGLPKNIRNKQIQNYIAKRPDPFKLDPKEGVEYINKLQTKMKEAEEGHIKGQVEKSLREETREKRQAIEPIEREVERKVTEPTKQPLIQEAKKYKSAEELWEAQPKVYHQFEAGEKPIFREQRDLSKAKRVYSQAEEGFYFSPSKSLLKAKYGKSGGETVEVVLDMKNPLNLGKNDAMYFSGEKVDYGKLVVDNFLKEGRGEKPLPEPDILLTKITPKAKKWIQEQGYDSVIGNVGKENMHVMPEYVVFNKSQIKTKSQLTDIWKQAQGEKKPIKTKEAPEVQTVSGQKILPEDNKISKLQKKKADLARKTTIEGGKPPIKEYQKINEEIEEEVTRLGIAMRTMRSGKKVPAIRKKSGVYAEIEFEGFPFNDAGGKTDTMTSWAAAADNITEGQGFGPMYKKVAAPAYRTILDRNEFIGIYSSMITNLAKEKGMTKGVWQVLNKKDGEIIFHLLEGKEVPEATTKHKEFVTEMRKIYDELRTEANKVRKQLGKKEIGYIENYASHTRKTALYQDLIKEFRTELTENFDYIIPNAKKNPYAMKRLGEMEEKETNFWKIIDGYVNAVSSDIYLSPLVEKLKAVGSVLEGRGMFKSKKFLDQYIRSNLLKKPDPIDNYVGMKAGSIPRKIAQKVIRARQLGALAGNIEWIFFTQPMSLGNTVMKTGMLNTLKGMSKWFNPKVRKGINPYTVMGLKSKAGVVTTAAGDIESKAARIYKGRVDKFNQFLGLLGDTMEYHLTGASVVAGIEKGKAYGLKGEDLKLYADYIGQVTQSMYNPETRMQLLNSISIRTGFPFQTFSGEMFRHIRTMTGRMGGLPLKGRQRLGHAINLIIASLVVNAITRKMRGRELQTVGSFIPLVGGVVDELISRTYNAIRKRQGKKGVRFVPGRSPVAPAEDARRLAQAVSDVIQYGNFRRFRKELVFWGMGLAGFGGGGQVNDMIDGIIALEKGYYEDVRGRKMFPVKDWNALWRGPWGTKEGREYLKPKKKKEKFSF